MAFSHLPWQVSLRLCIESITYLTSHLDLAVSDLSAGSQIASCVAKAAPATACAAHPACASLGYEGECCPVGQEGASCCGGQDLSINGRRRLDSSSVLNVIISSDKWRPTHSNPTRCGNGM